MEIQSNIGIHNRFDFEVRDARTGELKQQATAYNIVLNQMYTQLVNFLTYHNNIHFGTGTGTLAATRTTLFTWLGQKASTNEELIKAMPTSSWKKKIVLNPEEFVGSTITEVGIGHSSTASSIVTHALLQDAEGNPISITKTDIDVVTIYATVYVTFSTQNNSVKFVGMPNNNQLVNYLIGGTSFPSCYFYAGELVGARNELQSNVIMALEGPKGNTSFVTVANWVKDAPNKKATTPAMRFATTAGNGHIVEIGFGASNAAPVYSSVLPVAGTFAGQAYSGVSVGSGDGAQARFALPSRNVRTLTIVAKINGVSDSVTAEASAILSGVARPSTMPGSYAEVAAWSNDGNYLAVGCGTSGAAKFTWYKRDGDILTALTSPATLPGDSVKTAAWSGDYLAVGSDQSDSTKFIWYKRVGDTLTALPNPTTMPGNRIFGLAWSGDYLVVGSAQSDSTRFAWYRRDGDILTPLSNPTTMPEASPVALAWSGDYLAVGSASSTPPTKFRWYKRVGDTLTALPNPSIMPSSTVWRTAWSDDGIYLAVCCLSSDASRFLWYKRDGDTLTALANPSTMPGNTPYAASWSGDNLAVGSNVTGDTKFIWYKRVGDTLTALPNPTTMPGDKVRFVAWSGERLAVCSEQISATQLTVYNRVANITDIIFSTPPANGAAITADYTVDGIHKTDQYVIDVSFALQYGEVTP